jgi:hypothetical protein
MAIGDSAYNSILKKNTLAPKDMPLETYQKEQSMFSGENPYSQPVSSTPAVEDLSGPVEPGMVESGKMTQKQFDVASQQPGEANSAMNAGADALIMFGDPSMKALGLGLKTVQGISQAQQQQKQNKYAAEVRKIQARQEALNSLANIGRGLKA